MFKDFENAGGDAANASGREYHAATLVSACVIVPNEKSTPSMNKSTTAISLVLMGSALALAGCSSRTDDDDNNRVRNNTGHGGYGGGRMIAPVFGGGTGGGRAVSAAPSARGGFGGTGAISSAS
jgi:hypothetical protein